MPGLQYLDFELLVEFTDGKFYTRVLSSPAGQASAPFGVPFSPRELEQLLYRLTPSPRLRRRDLRATELASAFGGRLFDALFPGEVRSCFFRSLDVAAQAQMGLRLRLRLGDQTDLTDAPWELLYDRSGQRFIALSDQTPLVRHVGVPRRNLPPISIDLPLRVLVILPAPPNYVAVDIEHEWKTLTEALESQEKTGRLALQRLETPTLAALQRALRQSEYHVLHFIGYGDFDGQSQDSILLMENEERRMSPVSVQSLGVLLSDHTTLRLVVLKACEGARSSSTDPLAGAARGLVTRGVPAVVAMQFEISDEANSALWGDFYQALS
ncbi:MAG: CHAT domain-containing protein, partial [Actinomycetota bacterium]